MSKELERAQDMIDAMRAQRDTALNTVVMAQADINAHKRTIAELQAQIATLKQQLEPKDAPAVDAASTESGEAGMPQ